MVDLPSLAMTAGRKQGTLALLLFVIPFLWTAQARPLEDDHTIRVRLLSSHHPRTLTVEATGGAVALFAGDYQTPLYKLGPDEQVTISTGHEELDLQAGDGRLHALSVRIKPEEGAAFTLQVTEGKPLDQPVTYEGSLHVQPVSGSEVLRLVNHVALEDYVASVLSSEYGLDDWEGTKAMAVAIRTYALRSSGKFGAAYDHVDQVLSQRYEGKRRITERSRRAARQTRGEVLTYDGELIEAVYFSSSGGHTADNEAVWEGNSVPYLRGRDDPYDSVSPHSEWRQRLSRPRLLSMLSDYFETRIAGFYINDRSADGRVRSIILLRANGSERRIQSNRFRLIVNRHFGSMTLKSTYFEARRAGSEYVFEGKGFGHGVGLSQWGAHGQALQGRSYRDILSYYYTGVRIRQLGNLDEPAQEPPPAPPVAATPSASSQPESEVASSPAPQDSTSNAPAPPPQGTAPPAEDRTEESGTVVEGKPADSPQEPERFGW